MKKNESSELKVITMQGDSPNTPFPGLILPNKINLRPKDILRIQSQIIRGFIKGTVVGQNAKDLSYLCSTFLQNLQIVELEARIEKLENSQTAAGD